MRKHISNQHVDTESIKCLSCGKEFNSRRNLLRHKKRHDTTVKEFKCDICNSGVSYKRKELLNSHIENVHDNVIYKCELCQKQLKSKSSLRQHKKSVHEIIRSYKCDTCDMAFKLKKHLNAHIYSLHERTGPSKCIQCGKEFKSTTGLYQHIKTIHEKTKFICHNCDKTYATSSGLRYHQKVEHEKMEYTCEECRKKFSHIILFKNHIVNCQESLIGKKA